LISQVRRKELRGKKKKVDREIDRKLDREMNGLQESQYARWRHAQKHTHVNIGMG
jgi:hypothetical protein